MKFSIEDFLSKCDQIHNGKLHFLCSVCLLKSMVKSLFKFNTTTVKQSSFNHLIIADFVMPALLNTVARFSGKMF